MLAHRITYLRKALGMTQAQLASSLKLSPSALGMYEQGRRTPDINMLVTMSKVFNVSLDYLITGSESNFPAIGPQTPSECPCTTCYWKNYLDT